MEYRNFSAGDFAKNGFFIKWVKGSDPEASWFWESFLKDYPEKASAIEEARKMVLMFQFEEDALSDDDISDMRNTILKAVHAEKGVTNDNPFTSTEEVAPRKKMSWLGWAAAISIPVSLLIFFYASTPDSQTAVNTPASEDIVDDNLQKRINPNGQKSVLLLSDGSKVWLNAGSQLDYKKDFGMDDTRDVYLEGEAYFEVAPNPSKPFIVHTTGILVQVLGTAFNVKSFAQDKTIETTLVHGKVSINKMSADQKNETLILEPNQRAVFVKESNTVNVQQVVAERASSWRLDKLIFDDTPFSEVISQLERWYDVKIHVEDPDNLSCELTAEIEKESLVDVLKLLEVSQQITFTVDGNQVYIEGSICK